MIKGGNPVKSTEANRHYYLIYLIILTCQVNMFTYRCSGKLTYAHVEFIGTYQPVTCLRLEKCDCITKCVSCETVMSIKVVRA